MYHFGLFKMFLALYFESLFDLKISVICKAESDLDTRILLCGKYFLIRYHMTLLTKMHLILSPVLLVEESIFSSPIVPMVKQTSPKVLSEHVTTSANSVECNVTNLYFLSTTSYTGTFLLLESIQFIIAFVYQESNRFGFFAKNVKIICQYEPFYVLSPSRSSCTIMISPPVAVPFLWHGQMV